MQHVIGKSRTGAINLVALLLAAIAFNALAQPAPPLGLEPRGVVRLQLGEDLQLPTHNPRRFVWEQANTGAMLGEQFLNVFSKCLLASSGDALINLTATGGKAGVGNDGQVGLGPDSIGVFDGPRGVACYRISFDANQETLGFTIGDYIETHPTDSANAYYQVELDMELKGDTEHRFDVLIDGLVTQSFLLRSGSRIVPGEGYPRDDGAGGVITECPDGAPDCHITNALDIADSGSDAGPRDNGRWLIEALGNGGVIANLAGDGSLEGGGDYAEDAYVNNSLIYLTEADDIGALGCISGGEDENDTTATVGGSTAAQCTIVRQDPSELEGGTCNELVSYVFRSTPGANECEFITPQSDEQTVMNIVITFNPETAPDPETAPGESWDLPATQVIFGSDPLQQSFDVERCDQESGGAGEDGPLPIPAVLEEGVDGKYDLVKGSGQIEWACAYLQDIVWISENQVQLTQGIQFWGDIRWSR